MKISIAVIMLVLASSASAQMRAELKLEITPLLGLQRNYTEEIRSSRDTVKTETKEENTLQELPSQNIHLISTNNSQTQNLKFYIETGGSPRSLKHQAEIIIPIELITKETENASEIEFSISGYYNTSTENFQNTKINESFKYTFNKIKLSGTLFIQYLVPENTRQLYIQSSALEKSLSHAKTQGMQGTLTEELELLGKPNRFAFVQPLSIIEQTIIIPERDFSSISEIESYLNIKIKRNLHISGVEK